MSITFSCPHCGRQTDVEERYAGTSGPCSGCGQIITIPNQGSPFGAAPPPAPSPPPRTGVSLKAVLAIGGLLLIPCLCIAPCVLMPALNMARESTRRERCGDQVERIAIAIADHGIGRGNFPPASIVDQDGKPLHSWRVLILPYFNDPELQSLYDQYDFEEPWDGPNNRKLTTQMPDIYRCPSQAQHDNTTSYLAVVGEGTVLQTAELPEGVAARFFPSPVAPGDVSDGFSRTVCVVEVLNSGVNWLEPADLTLEQALQGVNSTKDGTCISSKHAPVAHVGFLDGHAQFVSVEASPEALQEMLVYDDGNVLDSADTPQAARVNR